MFAKCSDSSNWDRLLASGELIQVMVEKHIDEIFDPVICTAFPEAIEDLQEAAYCLLFCRHSAAIFHLMRVIEAGVLRMARLAGIQDPKPSWGAILKRIETYALRTKHDDLLPETNQHIAFLREVLPRMQAIQHAWRNPISHVEQDLTVPHGRASGDTAGEIMGAVNMFMRLVALELPNPAPNTAPYGVGFHALGSMVARMRAANFVRNSGGSAHTTWLITLVSKCRPSNESFWQQ
jgi:hypothetical protein